MNSFQKIIDLFITIITLFLIPILYSNLMLQDIKEITNREYVRNFVSLVQAQVMLTKKTYEELETKLFDSKAQGEVSIIIERNVVALGKENQIEQYREEIVSQEVLTLLERYGMIRMQKGDCIKVIVNLKESDCLVTAAGYIRNENWRMVQE